MNWQWLILQEDGKENPINDYESMLIGQEFNKVKENEETTKTFNLITISLVVNAYSSVITNNRGQVKLLKKAGTNNRTER